MNAGAPMKKECIACGGPCGFFGRRRGYTYVRCAVCGTLQLSPLPSAADLERAYREEYAKAGQILTDAEGSRASTRTLHASLVAALKRHGAGPRILDYGTGWGGLVIQLSAAGFDAVGYDLSEDMVKRCQRDGLRVRSGSITEVAERELDAIVLASVFEHLIDPAEWLAEARARLRPGGLLVTTQPTAHFAGTAGNLARFGIRSLPLPGLHRVFYPPWHVALYSLEGMRRVVERAGFRMLEVAPAPQQREPGLTGAAQRVLELFNRAGWTLTGLRWPFFTGHNFVFERI